MDAIAPPDESAIKARAYNTVYVIGSVLVSYDYLLTLNDEVRCVWRRRFSGVTATFAVLRYTPITYVALLISAALVPQSSLQKRHLCHALHIAQEVINSGIGAFSCFRVYAITNKDKKITSLVALLMIIFVSMHTYTDFAPADGNIPTLEPVYRACSYVQIISASKSTNIIMYQHGMRSNRGAYCAASYVEAYPAYVQAPQTISLRPNAGHTAIARRHPLILYYYFMDFMNIDLLRFSQILQYGEIVYPLNPILIPIALCRFILRLRQASAPSDLTTTPLTLTDMSFIVGNRGPSLSTMEQDDADEEEEDSEFPDNLLEHKSHSSLG